jgi:hypothetical protein
MNTLENLIFGKTFRVGVKQAVQEAVAEANAMDLPKAYEPDFSQTQSAVALAKEKNSSHDRIAR